MLFSIITFDLSLAFLSARKTIFQPWVFRFIVLSNRIYSSRRRQIARILIQSITDDNIWLAGAEKNHFFSPQELSEWWWWWSLANKMYLYNAKKDSFGELLFSSSSSHSLFSVLKHPNLFPQLFMRNDMNLIKINCVVRCCIFDIHIASLTAMSRWHSHKRCKIERQKTQSRNLTFM